VAMEMNKGHQIRLRERSADKKRGPLLLAPRDGWD
jgi:hypothetical protein